MTPLCKSSSLLHPGVVRLLTPSCGRSVLVSLYANITNLRWDYDETTAIKGCKSPLYSSLSLFTGDSLAHCCFGFVDVTNPTKNDVAPFSLNPAQSSEFYVANYLWGLIEG